MVTDDLYLVPRKSGSGGHLGRGDQIINITGLMFITVGILIAVGITNLHFGAGIPGFFVFEGIFLDEDENSAIGFVLNFPFEFQVKSAKSVVADQIATAGRLVSVFGSWF